MEIVEGFGAMCSAWRVRGTGLLPEDYTESYEGALLTAKVHGAETAWGYAIPAASTNKLIYNSL